MLESYAATTGLHIGTRRIVNVDPLPNLPRPNPMSRACFAKVMRHWCNGWLFMKDAKLLMLPYVSMFITTYVLVQENWATQGT
ncbi:MAG: hypothetical protein OEW33_14485 [Nitrospirota bacterium]|nr:hypothetical protein [Nitrospirota bacterium]